MTAPTLRKINAAIAKHRIEIVKGDGYFYFAALEGAEPGIEEAIASVYSCHLRALSLDEWISHVEEGVAKFTAERAPAVTHEAIAPVTHGGAGAGNTYRFRVTTRTAEGDESKSLSTCARDVADTYTRRGLPVPKSLAGPYDGFGHQLPRAPIATGPAPQEAASISLAPSFAEATEMCLAVLESGTIEGKRMAREELRRYAGELDRLAAMAGTSFDRADTPVCDG